MEINEIERFNRFSLEEKGKLVFTDGAFIGTREYFNQRLVLYCLGEFFVEVWYAPGEIRIHRIDAFPGDDKRIDYYISSEIAKEPPRPSAD